MRVEGTFSHKSTKFTRLERKDFLDNTYNCRRHRPLQSVKI